MESNSLKNAGNESSKENNFNMLEMCYEFVKDAYSADSQKLLSSSKERVENSAAALQLLGDFQIDGLF